MGEVINFVPKTKVPLFNNIPADIIQLRRAPSMYSTVPTNEEIDHLAFMMAEHYDSMLYESYSFRPAMDCDDLF